MNHKEECLIGSFPAYNIWELALRWTINYVWSSIFTLPAVTIPIVIINEMPDSMGESALPWCSFGSLSEQLSYRIVILIPWIDSIASGTAGELLFLDVMSPVSYEGKAFGSAHLVYLVFNLTSRNIIKLFACPSLERSSYLSAPNKVFTLEVRSCH